jgi:hypothetical protein
MIYLTSNIPTFEPLNPEPLNLSYIDSITGFSD